MPSCPVCFSQQTTTLTKLTASQTAAFLCPPTKSADRHRRMESSIRKLWAGDFATIEQCQGCGFGFGHPFVAGDEEFYSIMHEQHGYPAWRWDYDVALKHVGNTGRALDIGAGRGFFLKGLPTGWKVHAVESTPTMQEHLSADGITVFPSLREAPAGGFSLVSMFQVLEHIADFHGTLAECSRALAPGGRLVITVPDGDAMVRQHRLTGAPDVPPNHIAKWTPATLQRVLQEHGFRVLAQEAEPDSPRHLRALLHLKVMADATKAGSIASRAYAVRNRKLRVAALGVTAMLTGFPLLAHWREAMAGGAFAMVAEKG